MLGLNQVTLKIIAIVLAVIGIFSFGYFRGHHAVQVKFDEYKSEVEAIAKAQEEKTKQIDAKNRKISEDTKNAYETRLSNLRTYYGLRLANGVGSLPKVSNAPEGTDGYSIDHLPAPAILAGQCAETTLTLISLQSFIRDTASE